MTVLSTHHYRVGGVTLATYATGLESVAGAETLAALRLRDRPAVAADGSWPDPTGPVFFGPKHVVWQLWVNGEDANGLVTSPNGRPGHMRDNLSALLAVFGAGTGTVLVEKDVPDGAGGVRTLRNWANVGAAVPVGGSHAVKRLRVPLTFRWPFWRDITAGVQTVGPFTGAGSFTPTGDAPAGDLVLTCTAAGTLTHTDTGDTVTVDAIPGGASSVIITTRPPRSVVTNLGADARNQYGPSQPWGLRFPAGVVANLSATGTWQVDSWPSWHE